MRDGGTHMMLMTTSLEYVTNTLVVLGTISLIKKRKRSPYISQNNSIIYQTTYLRAEGVTS